MTPKAVINSGKAATRHTFGARVLVDLQISNKSLTPPVLCIYTPHVKSSDSLKAIINSHNKHPKYIYILSVVVVLITASFIAFTKPRGSVTARQQESMQVAKSPQTASRSEGGDSKQSKSGSKDMNQSIVTKDIPEHGLVIVGPADLAYDDMVASLSQSNPDADVIEALRPYSVFVKNTSNRAVVACTLKWELTDANGATKTETTGFIATWRLMNQGASGAGGSIIKPRSEWFFAPSNTDVFQNKKSDVPFSPDATYQQIQASFVKELIDRFEQYQRITVSLDGAFFDDGTFVGPDTTQFFTQVEALRNARRDLYSELEQGFKRGDSLNEVFKQAESLASAPDVRLSVASTAADLYNHTKKNVAAEILRMRNKVGDQKTLEFVARPLRSPRIDLKKK